MGQSQLSVLFRAAEFYANAGGGNQIEELSSELYSKGVVPFSVSEKYPLPLHLFSPRIMNFLANDNGELDARKIWDVISSRESIIKMITATELDRPAAECLSSIFSILYPTKKVPEEKDTKRKQMIGYMIKVVMEMFGYEVYQKRMQISASNRYKNETRSKNYFATASRYKKIGQPEITRYIAEIADPKCQSIFEELITLLTGSNTDYQKRYALDQQTNWEALYRADK